MAMTIKERTTGQLQVEIINLIYKIEDDDILRGLLPILKHTADPNGYEEERSSAEDPEERDDAAFIEEVLLENIHDMGHIRDFAEVMEIALPKPKKSLKSKLTLQEAIAIIIDAGASLEDLRLAAEKLGYDDILTAIDYYKDEHETDEEDEDDEDEEEDETGLRLVKAYLTKEVSRKDLIRLAETLGVDDGDEGDPQSLGDGDIARLIFQYFKMQDVLNVAIAYGMTNLEEYIGRHCEKANVWSNLAELIEVGLSEAQITELCDELGILIDTPQDLNFGKGILHKSVKSKLRAAAQARDMNFLAEILRKRRG